MHRPDHLQRDDLAAQLLDQGFSIEVAERAAERAGILEHDAHLSPIALLIAAAVDAVDGTPAARRYHQPPRQEGTLCVPPTPPRTAVAC